MKAIETEYKGYRFRSRLEARWAVFFDACGVKWEYEPEGFDLGNGLYYLPDFLLHDVLIRNHDTPIDLWVEVKGKMTEEDAEKIIKFAHEQWFEKPVYDECRWIKNPILIVTTIPDDDYEFWIQYVAHYSNFSRAYPFNFELIDGDWFGAYPVINKQGRFVIMDDNGRCSSIDEEGHFDVEATGEAYRLARQARFEHGEIPVIPSPSKKLLSYFKSENGFYDDLPFYAFRELKKLEAEFGAENVIATIQKFRADATFVGSFLELTYYDKPDCVDYISKTIRNELANLSIKN